MKFPKILKTIGEKITLVNSRFYNILQYRWIFKQFAFKIFIISLWGLAMVSCRNIIIIKFSDDERSLEIRYE